jgi:uncharacterized protein YbaR (Trm112 family)
MTRRIITCVPVDLSRIPGGKKLTYTNTHYDKVVCPMCRQLMYLGPNSKAEHLAKGTPFVCMVCALTFGVLINQEDVETFGGP